MMNFIRLLYGREIPADPTLWHRFNPVWPWVRLTNGRIASFTGTTWRRWNGTKWEWKQDEETLDEFQSRVF